MTFDIFKLRKFIPASVEDQYTTLPSISSAGLDEK